MNTTADAPLAVLNYTCSPVRFWEMAVSSIGPDIWIIKPGACAVKAVELRGVCQGRAGLRIPRARACRLASPLGFGADGDLFRLAIDVGDRQGP